MEETPGSPTRCGLIRERLIRAGLNLWSRALPAGGRHNGPPDTPCGPLGLPSLEPSGVTRAKLIRGRVNKYDRIEIFNKNN